MSYGRKGTKDPPNEHRRTAITGGKEAAGAPSEGYRDLSGPPRDSAPGDEGERLAMLEAGEPQASVLMATVGRAGLLPRVVKAVLDDPACMEMLVVVDGTDPESIAALLALGAEDPRLRVIAGPGRGQLRALDEAAKIARGEIIVLLDDDVVASPGMITGHLRAHQAASNLVVVGPMPVLIESPNVSVATRLYAAEYLGHLADITSGKVAVLDALWTGNVSMRRADCLRVGMRSTRFTVHYHADRDLGYRMAEAQLIGRFDETLMAAHLHQRGDAAFLSEAHNAGQGRLTLHQAHPDRLGPFDPAQLIADLPRPLRAAVAVAGPTRAASVVSAWLMAAGRLATRLGQPEFALVCAKLARRLMQYRGATATSA